AVAMSSNSARHQALVRPIVATFLVAALLLTFGSRAQAADSYSVASGATATIDEHGVCKKVTNQHASGLSIFVPTKTSPEWSSFRSNLPLGVSLADCAPVIVPGSQTYSTAGTHTFTIPAHNTLTVQVRG